MKKNLLKVAVLALVGLVCSLVLEAAPAKAGTGFYYQPGIPSLIVNSVGGPTNQAVLSTNLNWPSYIAAGTSVTNVTPFSVAGTHEAIQLNVALTTTNGPVATNVIFQLGRSVQLPNQMPSGGVTNAAGTSMNIEWFATITNTIPAAQAVGAVSVSHALFGPVTGYSSGPGDGAVTTYYLGWITAPTGLTLTNYSVWVNGQ